MFVLSASYYGKSESSIISVFVYIPESPEETLYASSCHFPDHGHSHCTVCLQLLCTLSVPVSHCIVQGCQPDKKYKDDGIDGIVWKGLATS